MARTNNLSNFLTDVADAIRTKKGSEELIAAEDFDTEIENLPSGGDLSEYFKQTITSGNSTYPGYVKILKKIPAITNTGTSCEDMFYYFQGTEIDLSNFDTSNVTSMKEMFRGCVNLSTLDFSGFDTRNVQTMEGMFRGCEQGLTELDLSTFETPNLTRTIDMFLYCWHLTKLDIRKMTFDNVTNYTTMFNGIPNNCEIIVKDDTQKSWITSKWSNLTNVKTVAEYEAEQNA